MQNLGGQTECIMGNWKIVNEINNAELVSQLDFSFFPTPGFPTRIPIQIEFARPLIRHIFRLFLLPRTPLGIFKTEHASR